MTNCLVSLLFVTCVRQLCSDSLKARYPVVAMFAHAQTFDGLVVVTRRLKHFFRIGKNRVRVLAFSRSFCLPFATSALKENFKKNPHRLLEEKNIFGFYFLKKLDIASERAC